MEKRKAPEATHVPNPPTKTLLEEYRDRVQDEETDFYAVVMYDVILGANPSLNPPVVAKAVIRAYRRANAAVDAEMGE